METTVCENLLCKLTFDETKSLILDLEHYRRLGELPKNSIIRSLYITCNDHSLPINLSTDQNFINLMLEIYRYCAIKWMIAAVLRSYETVVI